jgi:hypothetical protein
MAYCEYSLGVPLGFGAAGKRTETPDASSNGSATIPAYTKWPCSNGGIVRTICARRGGGLGGLFSVRRALRVAWAAGGSSPV